jgi:hypothetical protein
MDISIIALVIAIIALLIALFKKPAAPATPEKYQRCNMEMDPVTGNAIWECK